MAELPWLSADAGGVVLAIHARPGAKGPGIAGVHGAALSVRLAARPVDGAANRELIRVLADALGVSRSAVVLRAGEHGREKRVLVAGVTVAEASARLRPFLSIDTGNGRD